MASPIHSGPTPHWLVVALALVAVLAVTVPALVVTHPPRIAPRLRISRAPVRIVPQAELPPVEPVAFRNLPPDDARTWNAGVPFSTDPNPAARPFRLGGGEADRARAVDCMAAAMLYEAGDDPVGERAVGQVVINRVRHPAFPKSICGVVFQGQERKTGCQFTFTCDGAIARPPRPEAWLRAQQLAIAALTGDVFAKVGYSTHYHTDWVVPYWSASLDKVAAVHTHLFFRWTGWWGTPPAFRRKLDDIEPTIDKLAALSPAHGLALVVDDAAVADAAAAAALLASTPGVALLDDATFLVTLDRKLGADQLAGFAQALCGPREYCKLLAWRDKPDTPRALPASPGQLAAMAFSYLRDRPKGFDKSLWNCAIFKRADPHECMKVAPPPVLQPNFRLEALPGGRTLPAIPKPGAPKPAAPKPASPKPPATPPQTSPPATP